MCLRFICRYLTQSSCCFLIEKRQPVLSCHGSIVNCYFFVYRKEALSPYFTGDILEVAEKCWEQIHSNIGEAIEVSHTKLIVNHCYNTILSTSFTNRLSIRRFLMNLERWWSCHNLTSWNMNTVPPNQHGKNFMSIAKNKTHLDSASYSLFRRPSGIPREDYEGAAGAETRLSLVPQFEQKYIDVSHSIMYINNIIYPFCASCSHASSHIGAATDPGATEDHWGKTSANSGSWSRDKNPVRTFWHKNIMWCCMHVKTLEFIMSLSSHAHRRNGHLNLRLHAPQTF